MNDTTSNYYNNLLVEHSADQQINIQYIDSTYNKGITAKTNILEVTEIYIEKPHISCRLYNETITHTHKHPLIKTQPPSKCSRNPLLPTNQVGNWTKRMYICDYCYCYFTTNIIDYIKQFVQHDNIILPLYYNRNNDTYNTTNNNSQPKLDFEQYEHEPVYCTYNCDAIYCSIQCRDNAYNQYHNTLCIKNKSTDISEQFIAALDLYTKHATTNNETFIMLSYIFADIYQTYINHINKNHITHEQAIQHALYPYLQYNNELWHIQKSQGHNHIHDQHYIKQNNNVNSNNNQQQQSYSEYLNSLCYTSYTLLSEALKHVIDNTLYTQYFTYDLYSRLLGSIEMNQYKLTTRSPSYFYYQFIMNNIDDNELQQSIISSIDPVVWQLIEAESQWVVTGSGLFRLSCCINHSCEPNTMLDKPSIYSDTEINNIIDIEKCDNSIVLISNQDIEPNQQIFVDYLEDDIEDVNERNDELADYGFKCPCDRCVGERQSKTVTDDDDDVEMIEE